MPVKIGYINSALLLQQAPGRAEAEAQFDREVGTYRQQLSRMNDSLNALMAAFDRDAPKLDTLARATRGKPIRDRETEYQDRARGLDSTMQARQAQLVKPIMERVQGVIEAIRAEDGYSMILDVGAQQRASSWPPTRGSISRTACSRASSHRARRPQLRLAEPFHSLRE